MTNFDGHPFCGTTESEGFSGHRPKWNSNRITWGIDSRISSIAGISRDSLLVMGERATAEVASVCGLQAIYEESSQVNILTVQMQSDGQGRVLGLTDIPPGDGRQLLLRLDPSELFVIADNAPTSRIDLYRVWLHELLHALGVFHIAAGNLLAPFYSSSIAHLKSGDVAELVARYGLPSPPPLPPSPPATPTIPGEYKELFAVLEKGGSVFVRKNGVVSPL